MKMKDLKWEISHAEKTEFTNQNGVYQDGALCLCRSHNGFMYGILGHTHLGGVTLWKGGSVDCLEKMGAITYNFKMGVAGVAFDGENYPDGPKSRGGLWPYGLWIDPISNRFHCFIHNETAWEALETNYNAYGLNEGEPDFRHIGLMTSDDEGLSWDFSGWILTSHEKCYTTKYSPLGLLDGQSDEKVRLGCGDFTLFEDENSPYLYIFYTQIDVEKHSGMCSDSIYVARSAKEDKGLPGTWKKFYNGEFLEDGNMGKETPILLGGNVPCVSYNTFIKQYIMTSYNRPCWIAGQGACQIAFSKDLVRWSEPILLAPDREELSKPYFTICNINEKGKHDLTDDNIRMFFETNGKDVEKVNIRLIKD